MTSESLSTSDTSQPHSGWLRHAMTAGKVALFALVCWFIYRTIASSRAELGERVWHADPWWLTASGVLYVLGMLPAAIFWQQVLLHTDQQAPFVESMRAYYVSQLGKYVPGKWMVIVLRRALLRSPTIESTVVAASVFYETFTMLAVGSALSAVVLIVWQPAQTQLIAAAVVCLLLMGVPIVPAVFQWLLHVLGVSKLNSTAAARFGRIGWRTITFGWLLIAGGWVVQGLSLWATLRGMGATSKGPLEDLSLHTCTVSLSVVAGFISQIPGGFGVREWVSMELVEPVYGKEAAAVSVIIYRLVMLAAELVLAAILYLSGKRLRRAALTEIDAELSGARER